MARPASDPPSDSRARARKGDRVIATHRKAHHDYHLGERIETGLVLTGTEVKSLRQGQASLAEAYAASEKGEIFLYNLHIPPYEAGNRMNHEPRRKRKLLLHRREIRRLEGLVTRKGQTLIPIQLYFRGGRAKLVLALATGKKAHDKRHAIAEREAEREVARAVRRRSRPGAE